MTFSHAPTAFIQKGLLESLEANLTEDGSESTAKFSMLPAMDILKGCRGLRLLVKKEGRQGGGSVGEDKAAGDQATAMDEDSRLPPRSPADPLHADRARGREPGSPGPADRVRFRDLTGRIWDARPDLPVGCPATHERPRRRVAGHHHHRLVA
jgi:hypothetical protein